MNKTITARELYARKPEVILTTAKFTQWKSYWWGAYYNHIPEVDQYATYSDTDRIHLRIYKDFNFDGRRVWILASVWFDGNPIMIIQNAGREGDDYACRFITDSAGYHDMVSHISSLRIPDTIDVESIDDPIDLDQERTDLLDFYGNHLDGYFERY